MIRRLRLPARLSSRLRPDVRARILSRQLSPRMMRDIGLEPGPDTAAFPPVAALIMRV